MPLPTTALADLAGTEGRLSDFYKRVMCDGYHSVSQCWQRSSAPDVACITASSSFGLLVQSKLFAAMSYAKHYNTVTQLLLCNCGVVTGC